MVLAGGSRLEDAELLTRMEQAVAAGAIGCSVGRNIFMHRSPEAITRALVARDPGTLERGQGRRRAAGGAERLMRAAFMTGGQRGRGPRGRRGAGARPARRRAPGRGVRHLRHRRAHVLQRRPEGARPLAARARAGGRARGGRSRRGPSARCRGGRSRLPRLDPHVRRVPLVHSRGSRTCARTTCSTATTRSPAPTRSGPACRRSRRRT